MAYTTPDDLQYVKTHEWVRIEGDEATVGITDYAQHALGDLVFIELPDVGRSFAHGDVLGVVESVKAASDLYAPVSGTVTAVNEALVNTPELINQDPYGSGWVARVKLSGALDHLLDAQAYAQVIEEEDH